MDPLYKREMLRIKCINNKKHYPKMELFYNITKPEIAYFLGYFWADGHVFKKTNSIKIVLTRDDANTIKDTFLECGNFSISEKIRANNYFRFTAFQFTDYKLHQFLSEHDYKIKSGASPDKILSKIPEHLRHYWWRGYFDGDGGFSGKLVAFTSVFQQDWGFYEKLCIKLKIKFRCYRRIRNDTGSKYSTANITRNKETLCFCDYIYKNRENDKIGLSRKYNRYKELLLIYNKNQSII